MARDATMAPAVAQDEALAYRGVLGARNSDHAGRRRLGPVWTRKSSCRTRPESFYRWRWRLTQYGPDTVCIRSGGAGRPERGSPGLADPRPAVDQ